MDSLIIFLQSLNIEKAIVVDFVCNLKYIRLNKYSHFQQQGKPGKYMGYVENARFRYYKTDMEGNEHTLW
ncbi:MAG: Crp/Fnr family transcriptional regulator, partial [Tannerella sp.]|nr:Crp/Fnr family transcriptional regulator [Tannerella sp.]